MSFPSGGHISQHSDLNLESLVDGFEQEIPTIGTIRPKPVFERNGDEESYTDPLVSLKISWRSWLALRFHDADYTAPVWLTLVAVSLDAFRLFYPLVVTIAT